MTYNELKTRFKELLSRKGRGSIKAKDILTLILDLIDKIMGIDVSATATIRKSYNSLAEANADKTLIDGETNKPLKIGQLISVVADSDIVNNAIYRLSSISADGTPTWERQAPLGDMSLYAKHGGSTKTIKEIDDEKLDKDYFNHKVSNLFKTDETDLFPTADLDIIRYYSENDRREYSGLWQTATPVGLEIDVPEVGTSLTKIYFNTKRKYLPNTKYILTFSNVNSAYVGLGVMEGGTERGVFYSRNGYIQKVNGFGVQSVIAKEEYDDTDIISVEYLNGIISFFKNSVIVHSIELEELFIGDVAIIQQSYGGYTVKMDSMSDPIRQYVSSEITPFQSQIDEEELYAKANELFEVEKTYLFPEANLTVRRYLTDTNFNDYAAGYSQTALADGLGVAIPAEGSSSIKHYLRTGLFKIGTLKAHFEFNSIGAYGGSGIGYIDASGNFIFYYLSSSGQFIKTVNYTFTVNLKAGITYGNGDSILYSVEDNRIVVTKNGVQSYSHTLDEGEFETEILIGQSGFPQYTVYLQDLSDPIRNEIESAKIESKEYTDEKIKSIEDANLRVLDVSRTEGGDGYYRYYAVDNIRFVGASTAWRVSGAIPVRVFDTIFTTSTSNSGDACHVFMDEDKTIMGRALFEPTTMTIEITQELWDSGVRYIGISFRPEDEKTTEIWRQFKVDDVFEEVNTVRTDVVTLANSISDLHNDNKNAYKGHAPTPFKDKILQVDKDLNILLLGDSVTALTNVGDEFENAPNLPYGCQHNGITFQLWDLVSKNKPDYDRFDSIVRPITEVGSFSISDLDKFNAPTNYGEHSPDNTLYRETATVGDSISFNWDLSKYEKLNFIGRMGIDATESATISCPVGKILVKHNERANPLNDLETYPDNAWVEANGYSFKQKMEAVTNHAHWVRNFPIKFKRVDLVEEEINITITNNGNGIFYYWGTERWNFTTTHITNIARAGRNTSLLYRNIIEELEYRDIDLIIWQLPLWNDLKQGGSTDRIISYHNDMIQRLSEYSNNWQDFQLIVNMYHTQLGSWKGNKSIQFRANGNLERPATDLTDWECCMQVFNNLKNNEHNSSDKFVLANLYNEVYNYAFANDMTMEEMLSTTLPTDIGDGTETSGLDTTTFTTDGTHLSSKGFAFYASLIAPMLYD